MLHGGVLAWCKWPSLEPLHVRNEVQVPFPDWPASAIVAHRFAWLETEGSFDGKAWSGLLDFMSPARRLRDIKNNKSWS